jgi:hypothetical protein
MHVARTRARMLVLVTMATIAWAATLPPAASTTALSWSPYRTWDLGSGITLTRWDEPSEPTKAFVLKFSPGVSAATTDVIMPDTSMPQSETLSRMGIDSGAIAAINGDFGQGRPYHSTAVDGALWQSGPQNGENFSLAADESGAFIGRSRPRIFVSGPTGRFSVDRWNDGDPTGAEVAAYSPEAGSLENPTEGQCAVRLVPSGPRFWTDGRKSVGQDYVIEGRRCRRTRAIRERAGTTVLATPRDRDNPNRHFIRDLVVDQTVSVTWTMGWPGVLDTIGGRPQIVDEGENIVPDVPCSSNNSPLFCKNPRTGVGFDAKGNLYLVVVDGRQSGWSVGLLPTDFADFFVNQLHVRDALNLDGGGSSEMWTTQKGDWCFSPTSAPAGCIVNRANSSPGGYDERELENALAVLPGPDPGEIPPPVEG